MVETGYRRPTLEFAMRCDAFFQTGRMFTDLVPLVAQETRIPHWLRSFVVVEARAHPPGARAGIDCEAGRECQRAVLEALGA